MSGTTLVKLPKQPLPPPPGGLSVGPSFSTIWLFVFLAFFGLFMKSPRIEAYIIIGYASLLLAIMYFFNTIDGWLHQTNSSVTFGHILIYPFAEAFGVTSTLLLLWGTFRIIWDEMAERFPPVREKGSWWYAAKVMIFIISLISIYYTTLFLALASAWVGFMSLNTINDIATKRTGFEIAKGFFNFAFASLILVASSATFLYKAKIIDGKRPSNRVLTGWLGTLFLCIRSFIEFVLILAVYGPRVTRRDIWLPTPRHADLFARKYIKDLEDEFGHLDPKRIAEEEQREDEHFDLKVRAYLATVIASRRMNKFLIDKRVFYAALDMLRLMSQPPGRLSSVGRLLLWIGEDFLKELIPMKLVQTVLHRRNYKTHLQYELDRLSEQCDWVEVHRLVGFLGEWRGNQHASRILPEIIPDHQRWLTWSPIIPRIERWNKELRHHEYYSDLLPLLALEGPDVSIQGLPTARQSPDAIELLRLPFEPPELLDDALNLLDVAIEYGGNAVGFLTHFVLHCGQLNAPRIERVRLCLAAGYHEQEVDFKSSEPVETGDCGCIQRDVANGIEPVSIFPSQAQTTVNMNMMDFVWRVLNDLKTLQIEFCNRLQLDVDFMIPELAQRICVLGSALRSAHWHSAYIPTEYGERFHRIPSQADLDSMIRGLQSTMGIERQRYMDNLADCIGSSQRDSYSPSTSAPSLPSGPPQDPIWYLPDDALEGERPRLRSQILTPVYETNPDLAIACLKQSKHEPDTFITTLLHLIPKSTINDMNCVNLAGFLGPRNARDGKARSGASRGKVHHVWKSLLLHMMRSLKPGIFGRCTKALERKSLKKWVKHLQLLYGDSYLDPDGGLGITKEKIKACLACLEK
ncbi:hypothetical protein E8E14_009423 [Neopestalotiopsis sp. 37M]|nr:hypothetical protein E8E14_009423 [Neopestalotiopsis sp. 37M]